MKNSILVSCLVLAVSACVAQASDSMPVVRVESTRAIKIAIINGDRANPSNAQLNAAFAESLGYEISRQCKMPVPVKSVIGSPHDAINGLSNGGCDFAVFIGMTIPESLVNSDFVRIKAVPASGDSRYVINLVAPNLDRDFVQTLQQAFPEALKGAFFQRALARHSNQAKAGDKSEWKIALASAQ